MANEDELRLRIIADTTEFERQMAELGKLSDTVTTGGGKSGGGGKGPDPLKERLDGLRAEIDLTDLSLRKTLTASQRKEQAIRQEASLGKLTQQQMIAGIQAEEQARETATASAIANFDRIEAELAQLDQSQQAVINRQKQLFFASERAKNGFTTMSGSMTNLVSNTKMANITFANFGRIVQDAPFGLLGISNNIDPLLNSFRMLRTEVGGTGLALRAMGAQLLGPAGLIFLLGSLLPTALLFAQRAMSNMKKETEDAEKQIDSFADAIKSAANSQTNAAISTLSYEEQVRVLSRAHTDVKNRILEQTLATERLVRDAEDFYKSMVFMGRMTQEQADRGLKARKEELGLTIEQDRAIRDSIASKLEEARANLIVERSMKAMNLQRVKPETESEGIKERARLEMSLSKLFDDELTYRIKQEQAAVQELLDNEQLKGEERVRLQAYYDNIAERLTAGHNARLLQMAIENERKIAEEKQRIRDKKEQDRLRIEERQFAIRSMSEINLLNAQGRFVQALEAEKQLELAQIRKTFADAELSGTEEENKALAAVEIEFARMVAMEKAEQASIYSEAVTAGLGAVFGENKAVQSAQVVVDTIMGANKAFASLMPNLPLALAAAAAVTANGITSLRRINATTKDKKSIDDTKPSAPKLSSLPFATDRPFLATPLASSVASTMIPGNVIPINVEARIDQAGLALAVRRGEGVIASRQIPFAS